MMIAQWTSNFATNLIISFFALIDKLVYSLVAIIVEGIFNIATIDLFGSTIGTFTNRIYVVLGIFMIFKISFSLLQAIINPDALTDKEKGMQKIIPRTITMICILVMLPQLFSIAREAQSKLLPAIPAIILGARADVNDSNAGISAGKKIASATYSSFFTDAGNCDVETNLANKDLDEIADLATATCGGGTDFQYEYMFLISTAIGIILVVLLLGFTIDVAIRTLKLGVLQLLAPIPVISYIDPKSQKDGAFSKWLSTCISTYLDLFIKMAVIYLMIFLLQQLIDGNALSSLPDGTLAKGWAMIFIILGVFFFAKMAPKFISDMLGLKGGSGMGVGLGGVMAGTAAMLGGAGLVGSLTAAGGAMNDQATAAGQGKAAPSAWGHGSDLAAQIKTGDKNAKGGIMNGLMRSANQYANQRQLAKVGLTKKTLAAAKNNKYAAEDAAAISKDTYDRFIGGNMTQTEIEGLATTFGHYDASTGKYDMNDIERTRATQYLYNNMQSAQSSAAKASSNYDKANKEMSSRGLDDRFIDENRPDPRYQARRLRRNSTMTASETANSQRIASKGGFDPNKR